MSLINSMVVKNNEYIITSDGGFKYIVANDGLLNVYEVFTHDKKIKLGLATKISEVVSHIERFETIANYIKEEHL